MDSNIITKPQIGFIPYFAALNGFAPDTNEEAQLKIATLFYEKLILPVRSDHFHRMLELMHEDESLDPSDLMNAWMPIEEVFAEAEEADRLKVFDQLITAHEGNCWDKKGKVRIGLRGAVDKTVAERFNLSLYKLRKLKKENPYGYVRERAVQASVSTGSALVWSWTRAIMPCAFIGFSNAEFMAANLLMGGNHTSSGRAFLEHVEVYVPSVRNLRWQDIIQLRSDRRVAAFREWLWIKSQTNLPISSDDVAGAVEFLWQAVDELKPNLQVETIKGFLSNVPLPIPVNPASIALSIKAVHDADKFERKFDWLLFLHSMRAGTKDRRK